MTKWKHRWVCPHWEFFWFQEDAPDIPFSERNRESGATFLDILNVQGHNVSVRADFYDLQGNADGRFGLEGIVGNKSVWAYRTDTRQFPQAGGGPDRERPRGSKFGRESRSAACSFQSSAFCRASFAIFRKANPQRSSSSLRPNGGGTRSLP
jgi:hypothetical protein